MSATVEWITAECRGRLLWRSNRQHYFALRRALAYRVPEVVSEVEHIVGARCSAVGIGETDILAPGSQKLSIAIKDYDGMSAARENVDVILTINADGSSIPVRVAGRKFAPFLYNLIPVLSFSENDGRGGSARGLNMSPRCGSAERRSCYGCGDLRELVDVSSNTSGSWPPP